MPFKRAAGEVFNILPDRMNLFLRYMSGVGNEGLKLDDSTLRSIRQATEQSDKIVDYVDPKEAARDMFLMTPEDEARFAEIVARSQTAERKQENKALGLPEVTPLDQAAAESLRKSQAVRSGNFDSVFPDGLRQEPIQRTRFAFGPGVPTSGPVDPYMFGTDKAVTQTLGRFMADVKDDGSIRVTDTYDMVNEAEDPDLVSGSFRPDKALLKLKGIYDPEARARLINQINIEQGNEPPMGRPPMDNRGYREKIKAGGSSPTGSPLSQVARAAMYLAPFKPQPFDIDITIPPTTR